MTKPPDDAAYSPERRTALLLTGVGTAGAYHAGVLRALQESAVKIDVVAGAGVGAVSALFAAVDGAQRLWEGNGFWRRSAVGSFYGWRWALRLAGVALAAAAAIVLAPLAVIAAGLIVFPIDFVLKMAGLHAGGLAGSYLEFADSLFRPDMLPTWLPRFVVLALTAAAAIAIGNAIARVRRANTRPRGGWFWQIVGPALDSARIVDECWSVLWDLIRGAARIKQPTRQELGRRYVELLADNLGQPGFRELLIAAHDVDVRADLVFALVSESRRAGLIRRATTKESEARRAGVVDLAGIGRDHLADAVAAALAVPVATEFHTITFAPESYWRGESHRLCDRPGLVARLVDELEALGVQQVILVTAAPAPAEPHQLHRPPGDVRALIGEYLQSAEAASIADLAAARSGSTLRLFPIRPSHNPIGPFDFSGGFDDRSNRRQPLSELLNGGYEDAFHQFIEPVLGASGEHVGV